MNVTVTPSSRKYPAQVVARYSKLGAWATWVPPVTVTVLGPFPRNASGSTTVCITSAVAPAVPMVKR